MKLSSDFYDLTTKNYLKELSEMRMYDAIMINPKYRKEVLIKFGFSEVSPLKVEEWFRMTYPMTYKTVKGNLAYFNAIVGKNSNVVPLKMETMSQQGRSEILDFAMKNSGKILSNIEQEKQKLLDTLH